MIAEFKTLREYLRYDFPNKRITPSTTPHISSSGKVVVESTLISSFLSPSLSNFVISSAGKFEGKVITIDNEYYLVSYRGNDYTEVCWVYLNKI